MPLVKDNLDVLMKLFKQELKGEYMMNDVTKCLYTSVLVMSIYMGQYGLSHIRKCDVDHVQTYYAQMKEAAQKRNPSSTFDPSVLFLKECTKSLMSNSVSSRYLYYIMMTNAMVTKTNDPNTKSIMFPGHVCVIEKFPNGKYHVYQSYINQYDLKGHYERNNGSYEITKTKLQKVFTEIENLYSNGTWTQSTTTAWKTLTHVDGTEFEGCLFKGKSYFCYRKVPITTCTNRLLQAVRTAMRNTSLDDQTKNDLQKLKTTIEQGVFSA